MSYKEIFQWDSYSDQPCVIKDKAYKKRMRKKYLFDYLKLFFSSIIIFPLSVLLMRFFKAEAYPFKKEEFYGLGVNLDKGEYQQELIEELGVKSLLIRIPLNDIQNLEEYYIFMKSFGGDKQVVLNIIQDRENIENKELLKQNITKIFEKFQNEVKEYQIGTTINRLKWGFFAVEEYLKFYQTVQSIRDESFPDLELLGPSMIDFEYHYTIRALFNNYPVEFDTLSSLLYVDRRGAPQNTQMLIFDTANKIQMLYSLVKLSSKVKTKKIYITEVNWPLKNTAPYAPTSEKECVSEELYTKYMLEYFEIAKETKKVQKVFWHQLIAPGYGLVDNRDGEIRKTEAFFAFKKLLNG